MSAHSDKQGDGDDRPPADDPAAAAIAAVDAVRRRKRKRPASYWVLYVLTLVWLAVAVWKTGFSIDHPDAWVWFGTPLLAWILYSAAQLYWPNGKGKGGEDGR